MDVDVLSDGNNDDVQEYNDENIRGSQEGHGRRPRNAGTIAT